MNPLSGRLPPPPPQQVAKALNIKHLAIDWLAGDGSDRCYYRIQSPDLKASLVLMQLSGEDAENLKKGRYDWIEVSEILKANKISSPTCVKMMPDFAAIIIDDYGDLMLESKITSLVQSTQQPPSDQTISQIFDQCFCMIAKLLNIKSSPPSCWTTRCFDQGRFVWELNFFKTKFLDPVAGLTLSQGDSIQFAEDTQTLAAYLSAHSRYFVHRDFHSRNLMIHHQDIAVIDFQDARLGPPSYDLVSLVFDSYLPLSASQRKDLLAEGIKKITAICGPSVAERAREEWKPMLLQRQLKALGSFGYLTIEKGKGNYLRHVRPALETLLDSAIFDERWPFISGPLLTALKNNVKGSSFESK